MATISECRYRWLRVPATKVDTRNNVIWLYARAWIKRSGANPAPVAFRDVPFPQMNDRRSVTRPPVSPAVEFS
jgi:hypothetical protein